ncbi:MAG: hypothetical protein OXT09_28635 [Myxococcales bacterium]|nr:hypothetical protein [Myxococcales bacterium]
MEAFLATFTLFALAMAAMAIGVAFSGRRLSGSCGGVAGKDCTCSIAERKACQIKQVDADYEATRRDPDGKAHLDVLPDRDL